MKIFSRDFMLNVGDAKSGIAFCALLLMSLGACQTPTPANITINTTNVINPNADQVGIWVNSTFDEYSPEFVDLLKQLKMKSIRHGWAYGLMDPNDPNHFTMSPCDTMVQNYITDYQCNIAEKITLDEIAQLTEDLDAIGFGVLSMDGINYTGTHDQNLANMSRSQREDFYIENAKRWVQWAKANNFSHFELGNENDLPGEMVDHERGNPWTPEAYGTYALKMAKALHEVDSTIKLGINGGFGKTPEERLEWWSEIANAAPELQNYIDFIVCHRYAFGLFHEGWSLRADQWGRLPADEPDNIAKAFPGKPVYITEIGGFQVEKGYVPHYRGLVNMDMLANVFLDTIVKHVQHWPTRWDDFGALDATTNTFNALGNGLLAYTKFAQPNLVMNDTLGIVHYFAAVSEDQNELSFWVVNHGTDSIQVTIDPAGYQLNEVWRLTSEGNDPMAKENELWQDDSSSIGNIGAHLQVPLSATSATIITFLRNQ